MTAPIDPIADPQHVRALLISAARQGRALSYAETLMALGHRFTRPRMRALCKTLDAVDALSAECGEPALAVLVVRESDGLPGQGWWTGGTALAHGHTGSWTGPDARRLIEQLQGEVFRYWAARPSPSAS